MKKALFVSIASLVLVVSCKTASQNFSIESASKIKTGVIEFTCTSNEEKLIITGDVNKVKDEANLTFAEPDNLAIDKDDIGKVLDFDRVTRKKEDTYAFARYVYESNNTYDFSLPKNIEINQKSFVAYFNIAVDDGDFMVPGEAVKYICNIK